MITKTFLDKTATIVKGSSNNLGMSPVCEISYGSLTARSLIYFNESKIKELYNNKTYADITKLHHRLKLYNCASIDANTINDPLFTTFKTSLTKLRTSSFDLIFFLIPQEWDKGRGSMQSESLWVEYGGVYTTEGVNWNNAKNNLKWSESGVYSLQTLEEQYEKFINKEESIIIATQHFDYGDELIDVDITNAVNKILTGDLANNGIGIAFSPYFEDIESNNQHYVGFFSNTTNTFFEPYLETLYDSYIEDDRATFYLNKKCKLYLYANIGGESVNLDELPNCTINEVAYEVKQATKGVYYIEVSFKKGEVMENSILEDIWSNIKYQGNDLGEINMEFVVLPQNNFFKIGNTLPETKRYLPHLNGIKNGEKLTQGDIRAINVGFRVPYASNEQILIDKAEYRIYSKNSDKDVLVVPYHKIEKVHLNNVFYVNTGEFVPANYYIDIRVFFGNEIIEHRNILNFSIINRQ